MQGSHIPVLAKMSAGSWVGWCWQLLLVLLLGTFIWYRVSWATLHEGWLLTRQIAQQHPAALLLIAALMPLNWLLEAAKWRLLIRPVRELSVTEALLAVLAGLPLGFVLSRGLGDWAGRSLRLRGHERWRALAPTLLGSFLQFSVTMVCGAASATLLWQQLRPAGGGPPYLPALVGSGLILTLILVVGALPTVAAKLQKLRTNRRAWQKMVRRAQGLVSVPARLSLYGALGCAVLRYTVFAFQFVLMLSLFGVALPWSVLAAGVAFTFAAKSVLPWLGRLGDLGVREASALFFFDCWEVAPAPVVAASGLLWLINIVVPTLPGLVATLRFRLN